MIMPKLQTMDTKHAAGAIAGYSLGFKIHAHRVTTSRTTRGGHHTNEFHNHTLHVASPGPVVFYDIQVVQFKAVLVDYFPR